MSLASDHRRVSYGADRLGIVNVGGLRRPQLLMDEIRLIKREALDLINRAVFGAESGANASVKFLTK